MNLPDNMVMGRWMGVHRTFWVLIQGLIHQIGVIEKLHNERAPDSEMDQAVADFVALLDASGAALKLAGDMSTDQYARIARDDMIKYDEKMSGLWSADHQFLIFVLARLRDRLGDAHRDHVLQAIDDCYEAHASVCEHALGGSGGGSLASTDRNAVETLRGRYKQRAQAKVRPADAKEDPA